jgi:hypothetical protein
MKRFAVVLLLLSFLAAGCQTAPRLVEAPTDIKRTIDTPLVIAIPGLNVPFSGDQIQHFGHITQMLAKEGIPCSIILYDTATHPLKDAADLKDSDYSIAVTRVLPGIAREVERENDIRKSQNLPPLTEVNLVTYSQGSVIALDIRKRLNDFKEEFSEFMKKAGPEWKLLNKDPELELYNVTATDYIAIKNIRIQRKNEFDRDYELRNLYDHGTERLARAFDRFQTYLLTPEKLYPSTPLQSGKKMGYPRQYPGVVAWFREKYPGKDPADSGALDFTMRYSEYKNLLPINFRYFSICGSFFGSPRANSGYFLLAFPGLHSFLVDKADMKQIEQTRLGSRHHLDVIKALLDSPLLKDPDDNLKNYYFIVGANGERGDGLVDQSSAHLSKHLYTHVRLTDILSEAKKHSDAKDEKPLTFDSRYTPTFSVTGLPVYHLPQNKIFHTDPSGPQMEKESKVYPFLLAFVKKNFAGLKDLHAKKRKKLRQFMVELNLPNSQELQGYEFTLRPGSKGVVISGRYFNPSTNTIVWTGVFKSKKSFLDMKESDPARAGRVIVRGARPFDKTIELGKVTPNLGIPFEIALDVAPGTNHFVEVESDETGKAAKLNLTLPSIFDLFPRQDFFKMMRGEK